MPSDSQALRKRTTSASTSSTSSRSITMLGALTAICRLNSARCSARIRPISLRVVPCSPGIVSIFKVTAVREVQSARRSKVVDKLHLLENMLPYFGKLPRSRREVRDSASSYRSTLSRLPALGRGAQGRPPEAEDVNEDQLCSVLAGSFTGA